MLFHIPNESNSPFFSGLSSSVTAEHHKTRPQNSISSSLEQGYAVNRRQLILYTSTAAIAASSTVSNALALNEWQSGTGESAGFKSLTAFYPKEQSNSNVSVVITGVGPDFTKMESWKKPPGVASKIIDCKSSKGFYFIEYTLQSPGESRKHLYSAIGMLTNGWYNRLYTVTGQYGDEETDKYASIIQKVNFFSYFDMLTEDRERISSALVEQVIILGSYYNIQIFSEMEGLFGIKLANSFGTFVSIDEAPVSGSSLEVARIQLTVPFAFKLPYPQISGNSSSEVTGSESLDLNNQVGTVGHQELPNVCLNVVLRDIVSFDEAVCNVKDGSKVIVEREEECAKLSDSAVACSVPHSNKKVRCKVMKQKSMAELGGPLSRGVLKSMRKVKRSSLLRGKVMMLSGEEEGHGERTAGGDRGWKITGQKRGGAQAEGVSKRYGCRTVVDWWWTVGGASEQ
ncbi:unnamed protein product [Vicia faba]|uniref:PsbP C-terminal domain-containing protein n=1 Tax=Vicia faba TaxID=3906 RepID=A0AAV1BBE3_VICFA|nr:unnamed protein product [Vicia faba]